jgi:hypothetical protein
MNSHTGRQIAAVPLLVALLVAGHGCSRDDARLSTDEALELFELSHISPQFDVVREFLDAQLVQPRATWTPEQFEVATRIVGEHLSTENLSRKILERLETQPDPQFTDTVLEWLRTPEVRQVHAAAATTTNAKAGAELKAFLAAEDRIQPSGERLALIERYDRAARRSSDSSSSLRLAIYGAGVMSDALLPSDARAGADALRQFAEQKSELLAPIFEELSAVTLQFAFRGMSDADVAAFVERSESEPGQWYYGTLSNVFLDTLEEISSKLGAAFVTELESQPDT